MSLWLIEELQGVLIYDTKGDVNKTVPTCNELGKGEDLVEILPYLLQQLCLQPRS